jgi:uncharacterized protein (UPF0333 family)
MPLHRIQTRLKLKMKLRKIKLDSKAQVSIEMIIILSLLLIVLIVNITASAKRNSILNSKGTEFYAKQVALQLSSELNAIHFAGDGVNKTINLPDDLRDGTQYNISIFPSSHVVDIVWEKNDRQSYSASTITGNFNGTLTNLNGQVNLSNTLGVIQIN